MSTEKKTLRIESRAPTRIDLAGGTVDIWPIYLFLDQPSTINLGIDLFAEARIEATTTSSEGGVILRAEDQKVEQEIGWSDIDSTRVPPTLALHLKLLRYFLRRKKLAGGFDSRARLTLSTLARSPAGAGLGGSSTLSIAMVGALAAWANDGVKDPDFDPTRPQLDGERWIKIVRDTETTVIQVPAGLQDYYGAMYGELQAIRWKPGFHEREAFSHELLADLEKRLLLFYSGQSRNSGINNWALFKSFIDQEGDVRSRFAAIASATSDLETALKARNWDGVGRAIAKEWQNRRTLASGISTPEMNEAFELAYSEGASAGKVCGAGGGGCFFVYLPSGDEETKKRIQDKVTARGIRALPFRAVPHGLEVKLSRA